MKKIKPKIYAHGSYVGPTGYNNHTREFFRGLSKLNPIKVKNFTIGKSWEGYNDECHNKEPYIDDIDKKLLVEQSLWEGGFGNILTSKPIYKNYPNIFKHDVNIILAEVDHHFFYQEYDGPKIAYTVWETTRYPKSFYDRLELCDQIWVASNWQRNCSIEQGMDPNKVKVIPEAVNSSIFYPNSKSTLPEYEDNRFKFLIFGRWDYRKSTKEIISAFLQEFGKDEPVDLVLSVDNVFAKDGFKNTEERLKHYNLEDSRLKIKHFPTREEYIKYLQKGHVFLSCARAEGWNLPLIEAMACGTPSIYSNCSAQLEFAGGKGLPVKIKGTTPAIGGEYVPYSQSELSGEFYEPDFEDLKKVMRDAYLNYKKYKKIALKESKEISKQFTWENAAKIANKEITNFVNNLPPNRIELSFDKGPKVEIVGSQLKEYKVEFINGFNNKIEHSSTIKNGMWTKCNKEYYIPWIIKIDGKIVHKFNVEGKKVKISFDSKSVGDTLAWMPHVLEFQKIYNCRVCVSSFHNEWFKKLEAYKDIKFIKPDTSYEAYVQYKIGWFKTNGKWDNGLKNPIQANTIPLIKSITDILNVPYRELNHGIDFKPSKRPIKEKYICIGPRSTAGIKEWPYKNWKELATKLSKKGYKIVNLSYEGFEGKNIINKKELDWPTTWNYMHHAEVFIGLGSGLSWVNWALNKHTIMINNFIPYGYEFTNNLTKIENHSVNNNVWSNPHYVFDAGDWDWDPEYQGTEKQHIAQKSITVKQVYTSVIDYLKNKK